MKIKFRRARRFSLSLVLALSLFGLMFIGSATARGLASSNGVDLIRGAWGGTINFPNLDLQINLYFREFGPDPSDPNNPNLAVSSGFLSFSLPDQQKRAKARITPMQTRYVDLGSGEFDMIVVGTVLSPNGPRTIRLTGKIQTFGSAVVDDVFTGVWHIGNVTGPWSARHLDRRKIGAPEIDMSDGLYFNVDVYGILLGPAGDPHDRNPYTLLGAATNIVSAAVQVDIPNGNPVLISYFSNIFTPDVDFIHTFNYDGSIGGLPVNGGVYTFRALDILGNPIAGVVNTDVYVGGNEPNPPVNVNATVTSDGIQVTWDPVAEIIGSFQPQAVPPLGFYQIELYGPSGMVYGVNFIQGTSYLIPNSKANFGPNDHGSSINELGDGTYSFDVISFSVAPSGSAGKGLECQSRDPAETVTFQKSNGTISILP